MTPNMKDTTQQSSEGSHSSNVPNYTKVIIADNQLTAERSISSRGKQRILDRRSESNDVNDLVPTGEGEFERSRSTKVAEDSDMDIEYVGTSKPGNVRNKIIDTCMKVDNTDSESKSNVSVKLKLITLIPIF